MGAEHVHGSGSRAGFSRIVPSARRTVHPAQPSSDSPRSSAARSPAKVASPCPRTTASTAGSLRHSRANIEGCQPPHTTGRSGRARLDGARHADRIGNRRPGQHRHPEAERAGKLRQHGCLRVRLQTRIDDDDLILLRVELGADGHQRQRHGEEHRARGCRGRPSAACGSPAAGHGHACLGDLTARDDLRQIAL